MVTASFNPREEKEALYGAVCRFHEQWERGPTVAIFDFCDAVERADEVPQTLEEQETLDLDTHLQIVQLRIPLTTAKQT